MAEDKKSFVAYADWKETFDKLPDEIAGKLIKHIFAYVNDENPISNDFIIDAVFSNIKNTLKRDLKKWELQLEQRRNAGKKSAEQRALMKINERSISFNEKQRNSTVSVSVSDSDINKVVIGEKTPKLPKSNKEELFNSRKESFRKDVAFYLKEYSKDTLRQFFDYWTEPNPSKTKMRWELQKTFDVNLRLKNWTKNEKTFVNTIKKPSLL